MTTKNGGGNAPFFVSIKNKIFSSVLSHSSTNFSADYNARRVSCVGPALRLGIDMRQCTRATQGEEGIGGEGIGIGF